MSVNNRMRRSKKATFACFILLKNRFKLSKKSLDKNFSFFDRNKSTFITHSYHLVQHKRSY